MGIKCPNVTNFVEYMEIIAKECRMTKISDSYSQF